MATVTTHSYGIHIQSAADNNSLDIANIYEAANCVEVIMCVNNQNARIYLTQPQLKALIEHLQKQLV